MVWRPGFGIRLRFLVYKIKKKKKNYSIYIIGFIYALNTMISLKYIVYREPTLNDRNYHQLLSCILILD